jgi:hypothetical protein
VNGHTAIIRSLGITGVLLALALVLLAIVSAIFAFDRWPTTGGASTVERVAVDRPDARRVNTVLVRADERSASVVRGAFAATVSDAAFATALGAGDAFLVGDREPAGRSDGGGFGPPPPSVPFAAPGEGSGGTRFAGSGNGGTPPAETPEPDSIIHQATCGARDALGQAGAPLEPACQPEGSGQRSLLARAVGRTVDTADDLVAGVTAAPAAPVTTVAP